MASSQMENFQLALKETSRQCGDLRSMSHETNCESATLKERVDQLALQVRQLPPDDERAIAVSVQMAAMNGRLQALKSRQREIAEALEYCEQQKRELQQQLDDMAAAP